MHHQQRVEAHTEASIRLHSKAQKSALVSLVDKSRTLSIKSSLTVCSWSRPSFFYLCKFLRAETLQPAKPFLEDELNTFLQQDGGGITRDVLQVGASCQPVGQIYRALLSTVEVTMRSAVKPGKKKDYLKHKQPRPELLLMKTLTS